MAENTATDHRPPTILPECCFVQGFVLGFVQAVVRALFSVIPEKTDSDLRPLSALQVCCFVHVKLYYCIFNDSSVLPQSSVGYIATSV